MKFTYLLAKILALLGEIKKIASAIKNQNRTQSLSVKALALLANIENAKEDFAGFYEDYSLKISQSIEDLEIEKKQTAGYRFI